MSGSLPGFTPGEVQQQPRIVLAYLIGHYATAYDAVASTTLTDVHENLAGVGNMLASLLQLCEAWCVATGERADEVSVRAVRQQALSYADEHRDSLMWLDHLVAANEGVVPS